ncbi:hypothetical protein [Roseivirga misakiensis]|uniref:hypothetical protein n=1 Tax=Roseivirga misakiensis TaxID=1563681 RepID=UPI00114D3A6C|nr:hypothetical protein [Roseivirga misakiensis]
MKRLAIIFVFIALFLEGNAQDNQAVLEQMLNDADVKKREGIYGHPSQVWHEGEIFLKDGERITGRIKYDLTADAVHFDLKGATRTFVANQIQQFFFFQEANKTKRYFITLPFAERGNYKRPKLFEIFYSGDVSLLAREEAIFSNWSIRDPEGVGGVRPVRTAGSRTNYDFFLIDKKGEVQMIGKGVKKVVRSFKGHHKQLRTFIKSNKLDVKNAWGMINLVEYYNTLE